LTVENRLLIREEGVGEGVLIVVVKNVGKVSFEKIFKIGTFHEFKGFKGWGKGVQ
jgi:hypothetical protein